MIREVDYAEYKTFFSAYPHVFNSADFNKLNAPKANGNLKWLLFESDSRFFGGIVLGERDGMLQSPFSAPFGGFSIQRTLSVSRVNQAVEELHNYAVRLGKRVLITLPPHIYSPLLITYQLNALSIRGSLKACDLNYHLPTDILPEYTSHISDTARKHLNRALRADLEFVKLDSNDSSDVARAYRVIEQNRREHGYPLRMTLEQVMETIRIVEADFFVVSHHTQCQSRDVASAQVFHVAPGIVQVVYWGHIAEANKLYPVNFLALKLLEYYASNRVRIIDIGPSSTDGEPDYGLCDFKQSIGCVCSPKFSFELF